MCQFFAVYCLAKCQYIDEFGINFQSVLGANIAMFGYFWNKVKKHSETLII